MRSHFMMSAMPVPHSKSQMMTEGAISQFQSVSPAMKRAHPSIANPRPPHESCTIFL